MVEKPTEGKGDIQLCLQFNNGSCVELKGAYTKDGPQVHGPGTPVDPVHGPLHGPGPWTTPLDHPLFCKVTRQKRSLDVREK